VTDERELAEAEQGTRDRKLVILGMVIGVVLLIGVAVVALSLAGLIDAGGLAPFLYTLF
jgi:hypothetical protein